ncbi:cytotoxic granule associated RNA binding protein TIA1 isoform X1 [Hydra vulgaris]|uniref:Cytotoxic granule associated RNA binding protein TIA1 isoform X2 n=1 Tax=Hydra vulgaris TaxID=6087 RepID=A0ABM4BM35_HYDVU|nr:cytotoxic granule associated RNA binding protein TIA1 [Hydra vulgaris]
MEPSDVPDTSATILYVGNLDKRVTDVMMLNILRAGLPHVKDKILSAKMFSTADITQGMEGYCFIQFQDNNTACQAMTFLNGRDFCGKKVKVNWATNSTNGGLPKVIGSSITIFVGDLDDDLTDSELRQAFEPFGEILNAKVVRDAATEKSKNYGFISFTNKPDAERAIRDMHGAMLKRRPIKTNWATRNQNSKPSQLDYDQVFKEVSESNCTVYVTNLPDRISDEVLVKHFEDCGKIVGTPRVFDGKNFAFIRFESHAAATTAIVKGNGSELNGAILKCWWGKDSESHQAGGDSYHQRFQQHQQSLQPTPITDQQTYELQQQQMQQYMYNVYYQQQYYQYWMQQYQLMQQQGVQATPANYYYNQQQQQQQPCYSPQPTTLQPVQQPVGSPPSYQQPNQQ